MKMKLFSKNVLSIALLAFIVTRVDFNTIQILKIKKLALGWFLLREVLLPKVKFRMM